MGFYSLNPQGRYKDEFKPRPVATTRVVASQPAQPAQTVSSPYRMQTRADGGTDFYNGNRKTTIEEFSKGTGNQVDAVRGHLASQGNKQEQQILTKRYFETKDPEVKSFNTLDVGKQRERLSQLQSAAGRKDFNTAEDAKNQRWASEQLANVQQYGKKKDGNLLTFGQDFVGGIVAPGKQLVDSVADTSQQYNRGQKLLDFYKKGQINRDEFNSAAQSVLKNSINRKAEVNAQGDLEGRQANPLEFGQKFATEGADAALTYSPVGAGYKSVAGLGVKAALPTVAKNVLKEGTAYTVANTGNDVLQGRGITPESLLTNALTSYGGAALGASTAKISKSAKANAKELAAMSPIERQKYIERGSVGAPEAPQVGKTDGLRDVPIADFKNTDTTSWNEAIQNVNKGELSKTNGPVEVVLTKNGYKLVEGNHRAVQALNNGDTTIKAKIISKEGLDEIAKRDGPHIKMGMQDSYTQKQLDAHFSTPAPQVGKTPKQPTPFEQSLQDAGIAPKTEAPTARSSFANQTVRRSKEVSDQLKAQVKSAEPTFQTVTDVERIAQSDAYLKKSGIKKATTDVRERLNAKQIDDQTVSDAIAVAKSLDQKGNPANLLEASAIYEELSVKLSKAGQTVQAASLLNNRTPAGLQYGAIRALKKSGADITDQMKKDIGGLVDNVRKTKPGSYEDGLARFRLQEYVSRQVPSSNTSKIVQLWKAGLLTSPRTSAGNLAGNTAESVFNKGYVDPLANAVDGLFSLFTGKRSRSYTLRGIGTGAKEGVQKGISYFKTGYDPRNPAQKFDVRQIHYSDTPLGKAAEVYTQTVFKLMGVADQPFYYANLRNSLYDQAITTAKNQGLKGAEKQAFIKKFVTEPETKAMQLADAEARYSVFQNETALGKAASRIKNMDGISGDIAEFVVPFSGVPSSIATRMIERTPIGTAIEIVKQLRSKKFDQRAMTKAIANGSAAIPLIGAGAALAASGQMTLGYPTDKKERDLWEAEGKQPYSIKVGDQWLSLNYFQPAGNLMAAGAEYQGARMDGKTSEEAFSQSLAGSAKAFSEQSFLKGVSSIGNAISDPSRFGQTFTESTAGSLVPNVIRTGARAFDPVKREVDNAGESIMSGIPGLRQNLDVKTNILGEPVKRNSSPLNELVNPTKPSDVQNADNPTIQELRRLQDADEGIVPTEATKSSLPDLDTKQLRAVNKEVATQVASEWTGVLNDPRYGALIDSDKKKILDRVNDTVFGAVKSDYKESKLNTRQQQYKDGEKVDYFDGFDSATGKSDSSESSYQRRLDAYNKGVKDGTITGPDVMTKKKALDKEAITSQYSNEVNDFYKLSNAEKNAYFKADPAKAKELYNQAKEMDAKLTDKGLATTKFNGKTASSKKSSSSSKKKSSNDFKLFGFEGASPESVGKNLRKLIEKAVV